MDKLAKKIIADGMFAFKASIPFTTKCNSTEVVMAAISSNPKLIYYVNKCSIYGAMNRCEVRVQYRNKEISSNDIYVINTGDECLRYMCQFAGNYKKRLTLVLKKSVDLNRVTKEFYEKYDPFYPNLTRVNIKGYPSYGEYFAYEFSFVYRIGKVKLEMMEIEVDNEVERISKLLFSPDMPEEVKIYLAHNYLAANVKYKDNDKNCLEKSYTQSAYGALIEHECVCQGYAEAFKRIMDYTGIQCDIVCGQIVGSTEYHAWNIVTLSKNNNSYHIDVTWDSAGRRPGYIYFCRSDSCFVGKRIWNREFNRACRDSSVVLSTAKMYVYKNKKALLAKGIDRKVLDC